MEQWKRGGVRGEVVSERANKSIETYFVGDKVIINSAGRVRHNEHNNDQRSARSPDQISTTKCQAVNLRTQNKATTDKRSLSRATGSFRWGRPPSDRRSVVLSIR